MRKVLTKPREEKLYDKASKCQIGEAEIEFLLHKMARKGICPIEEKLKDIREVQSQLRQGYWVLGALCQFLWAVRLSVCGDCSPSDAAHEE